MRSGFFFVCLAAVLAVANGCGPSSPPANPPVRVAVIGGMVMTGVWQGIAKQFEADTGYKVKVVMAGNKQVLVESFRKGDADFLTMHSTDDAMDLVAGHRPGLLDTVDDRRGRAVYVDDHAFANAMREAVAHSDYIKPASLLERGQTVDRSGEGWRAYHPRDRRG